MARLGPISTRYKDVYDLYYLISNNLVDINKTREILNLFFRSSKREPNDIFDMTNSIIDTLNDKYYREEAINPASKWIDVSYEDLKNTIVMFLSKL